MNSKRNITLSLLAYYLDGWADLIEGMGSKAEQVKREVIKQLIERHMPDVQVEEVKAKPGLFIKDYRDYSITTTHPGAMTMIYIGNHGNDLYTSWRTYITPPPNWKLLSIITQIASVLVFIFIIVGIFIWIPRDIRDFMNYIKWEVVQSVAFQWIIYAAGIFIILLIIAGVLGQVRRKDTGAYLNRGVFWCAALIALLIAWWLKDTGNIVVLVLQIFGALIKKIIMDIVTLTLAGMGAFLGNIFMIVVLIMLFSLMVKRNAFYYLTIQPNLFDAEDITAMVLSVHKSMIRALDLQGISVDKLRLKPSFKGGRKGEDV